MVYIHKCEDPIYSFIFRFPIVNSIDVLIFYTRNSIGILFFSLFKLLQFQIYKVSIESKRNTIVN